MTDQETVTAGRLRTFILDELNWERPADELTEEFPLIEGGALDSLGVYQLVSFIENEFGVEVDDAEIVRQNFATLRRIARFVDSKRTN